MIAYGRGSRALRTAQLLLACLGTAGIFLAESSQSNSFFFYVLTICVIADPGFWLWLRHSLRLPLVLLAGLLAYLAISSVWSPEPEVFRELAVALMSFCYVVTIARHCPAGSPQRFWLLLAACVAGVLAAGYALSLRAAAQELNLLSPTAERLSLRGPSNPVIAGICLGAAYLICLIQLAERGKQHLTWVVPSALVLLAGLIATQSRGALLASGIATLAAGMQLRWPNAARLMLPGLLLGIAVVSYSALLLLNAKAVPADPLELPHRIVNSNHHLNQTAADGRPAGVRASFGGKDPTNVSMPEPGVLEISSESDPSTGAAWPAIKLDSDKTYIVAARMRASAPTTGFSIHMEESNLDDLPFTHVAKYPQADEPGGGGFSQATNLITNRYLDDEWRVFAAVYVPAEEVRWGSILVLNWHKMGLERLFVDYLVVFERDRDPIDRLSTTLVSGPDSSRLLRAEVGKRVMIWRKKLSDLSSLDLLFGAGTGTSEAVQLDDPRFEPFEYEHLHSIFLSILHAGGIPALVLFVAFLVTLVNGTQPENGSVAVILIFAVVAHTVDGSALISKPNSLWVCFWLPAGLLLANTETKV